MGTPVLWKTKKGTPTCKTMNEKLPALKRTEEKPKFSKELIRELQFSDQRGEPSTLGNTKLGGLRPSGEYSRKPTTF